MIILVDKREKKWNHIKSYFDLIGQKYEKKILDFGDYSFKINDVSFEKKIVIETKRGKIKQGGGFAELENNLFNNKKPSKTGHSPKELFNIELNKAINHKSEFILLIENAKNTETILTKKFRYRNSYMYYNSFLQFLRIQNEKRKNVGLKKIKIIYSYENNVGKTIIDTFQFYIDENLKDKFFKNGKQDENK